MAVALSDAITLNERELSSMSIAIQTLTSRCMSKRGFVYPVLDLSKSGQMIVRQDRKTDAQITVSGFVPATVVNSSAQADETAKQALAQETEGDARFREARLGSEDGTIKGCEETANAEVQGSGQFLISQADAENLRTEALGRIEADPRYVLAIKALSSCMAVRGLSFADPRSAQLFDWPTPRPSAQEVFAAQADRECKSRTLFDVHSSLAEEYLQSVLDLHPSLIVDLESAKGMLLKRVAEILSSS
ncbi:MAG: hypothetical protein V9E89_01590 [Ilumatobacteraceae bacterium]